MATIDIQSGIKAVLAPKKRRYPCHVNRISQLDDPCLRRLYYYRAAWDNATDIDDGLAGVFETGNTLEPVIERIVSEVGMASNPPWRIVGSQTPTNDALLKEYQISGTIDGFLQVLDIPDSAEYAAAMDHAPVWETKGVVDIKTMSQNIYPRINSYDDLGRFIWTRKYRGQLMLYALAHNVEECFLLFVNKGNLYDMKFVEFPVDMGYCDTLLAKAKIVNVSIETDVPPHGVDDPDVCPRCQFYAYCAPNLKMKGNLKIVDNADLEVVLDRLEELRAAGKEISDLEAERDAMLVKGQNMACGKYIIVWKEIIVRNKPQWRKKIVKG